MTERQTRMEKPEERSEGGTLVVRAKDCGVKSSSPADALSTLWLPSTVYMNHPLSLWVLVFLLRFLQVVEEEAALRPSRPSSGAVPRCDPSWRTVIRSSSNARGKPNSSFCRAAAWRSFAPKENSVCRKWWDLALVVVATRKERWGRNFKDRNRYEQYRFLWFVVQGGQHYVYKTSRKWVKRIELFY